MFAAPGEPRWATVAEDARFEVRELEAGADWIVIDSAPNAEVVGWTADDGLYARRAWVRRRDLRGLELSASSR